MKTSAFLIIPALASIAFAVHVGRQLHQANLLACGPVTLPSIVSCRGYEIAPNSSLSTTKNRNPHPLPENPLPGSDVPPIGEYYGIEKGPAACNGATLEKINLILNDPMSYVRVTDDLDEIMIDFEPDYAYYLIGADGSLLILVETKNNWFALNKYDRNGNFIEGTGIVENNGEWKNVIVGTFPARPKYPIVPLKYKTDSIATDRNNRTMGDRRFD